MLEGSVTELNNKKISIGWKLKENGMTSNNNDQSLSSPSQPVSTTTTRLVAVPAGSRPTTTPPIRNSTTTPNNTLPQANTNKVQSIWTVHTIIF
jgi:hypothetical protein